MEKECFKKEIMFAHIRKFANPDKAMQMSAYMRDQFLFLGIPKPELSKLAAPYQKSMPANSIDWDFVFECWDAKEREFQYIAKDYLSLRRDVLMPTDVPILRKLAINKSWWDTVDGLDVIIGDIALRHPSINETLLKWSTDKNFWLRRIAIDHQLNRKEKTDTELLEQIIQNNFGESEFFINKAIGWALREYSKTNPDWVRDFIKRHKSELAPLSLREASKYI